MNNELTNKQWLNMTSRKKFPLAYLFAFLAIPIMIWEIWTIIAWAADGPKLQVDYLGTTAWYAARFVELFSVILSIIIFRKVMFPSAKFF